MDDFALLAEQRREVADVLETLTPEQWSTPSLCGEWTVQQVAAHLMTGPTVPTIAFMKEMVLARGRFNVANDRIAKRLAADGPDAIIARLRDDADHRFTPPGAGVEAPLSDVIVHAQDMFHPLGIEYTVDPATILRVIDTGTDNKTQWIRGTDVARRFAFTASDAGWSFANPGKPELVGPTIAIMMTLFGRTAFHDQLTGPTDQI